MVTLWMLKVTSTYDTSRCIFQTSLSQFFLTLEAKLSIYESEYAYSHFTGRWPLQR